MSWYVVNGKGDVIGLADGQGTATQYYQYDLWGQPASPATFYPGQLVLHSPAALVPQPLGYRGYLYDQETATYWLSVRQYSPDLRRFLQPDPSEQDGVLSYVYCGDNPVDCSDPSGQFPSWGDIDGAMSSFIYQMAETAAGAYDAVTLGTFSDLSAALGAPVDTHSEQYNVGFWGASAALAVKGAVTLGARVLGAGGTVEVGPTIADLRATGQRDAHHVIQDAAVRDVPGYRTDDAPGVRLDGPSTNVGSPHYEATQIQRTAGLGGTYGAERQVAAMSLRAAGFTTTDVASTLRRADAYFMDQLGLTYDSPLRIPGNRAMP